MTDEEAMRMIDSNLGIDMAYYAELASCPSSFEFVSGSDSEIQNSAYTPDQQHLNPIHLSWRSIATASEHAGYAEHMRYVTTGGVVPRPNESLARAALLGAARAVYILGPDDSSERENRAARIANTEANDAARMIENWESQNDPNGFIDDLRRYAKNLSANAGKVLSDAGLNSRSSINETELLRLAISELPGTPLDSVEQTLTLWNRLSGVAHARSWTWNLQSGIVPREDFVGIWFVPVVTLCRAWYLWNLRRGKSALPYQAPDDWEPNRLRWGPIPN